MAAPRLIEDNGLLAFVEFVLLPAAALSGRREFYVERDRDGLEPLVYTNINQIHDDYKEDVVCYANDRKRSFNSPRLTVRQLTPQLLKHAVTQSLIKLMAPIQAAYQASSEWQEITTKAYPPVEKKKKEKLKDKGSRHPGPRIEGLNLSGS